MRMDLHVHCRYSVNPLWGKVCVCTPEEVIKAAVEKGLGAVAITDHDAIEGALLGNVPCPIPTFTSLGLRVCGVLIGAVGLIILCRKKAMRRTDSAGTNPG
jgi:hypothetical protein